MRGRANRLVVLAVAGVVGAVALAGCSGSEASSSGSDVAAGGGSAGAVGTAGSAGSAGTAGGAAGLAPAAAAPDDAAKAAPQSAGLDDNVLDGRSVVRTATLTVRVDKVLPSAQAVSQTASALGGFVAGEQTTADPDHPEQTTAQVTVRVPSSRLPALLDRLHAMGSLLAEQQDVADVTAQVVDVQARLASQAASVDRVRTLLSRATTLGQVVQVEGELAKREAALESLQAQQKKLADQTSLATATVTLVGPTAVAPAPPEPAATGFAGGLSKGWHAFVTATTWLLTALGALLPFALLALLVGLPTWVLVRRRRARAPAVEPPAAAAA